MVLMQFLVRLDQWVFQGINSLAGKSSVIDWLARFGADDHIIPVTLALITLGLVLVAGSRSRREDAFACVLSALLAVALSMALLFALNLAFFRPRPFTSFTVTMLFYNNTDSAFPSNAATLAFALSFAVFFYNRRAGAVMLALAAYLGFARVLVGVHYPGDVAAGALLGFSSVLFVRAAEPLYRPLARTLNSAVTRLFSSWSQAGAVAPRGGGER